jgi:hypothetical protein
MENSVIGPELTRFHVRDAASYLERLSHFAFFAGLMRYGVMFAQIRLQLIRIESGIPLDESGWLCLADSLAEKFTNLEETDGHQN